MAALVMAEADGDGAADVISGAGDDDADDGGVLELLEPPQAVSPRRAAAVRPTKARAGRFVDNMSFSLFVEPGHWVHWVWALAARRCFCVAGGLCLTSYSEVAPAWMGAD